MNSLFLYFISLPHWNIYSREEYTTEFSETRAGPDTLKRPRKEGKNVGGEVRDLEIGHSLYRIHVLFQSSEKVISR